MVVIYEGYLKVDSFLVGIFVYLKFDDIVFLLVLNNDIIYIVNFWAIWCKFCVKELFYFVELGKKYVS